MLGVSPPSTPLWIDLLLHGSKQVGGVAKDKAGQASDALEEGARQAADAAQKAAADTSEAIESGAQQARDSDP